MVCEPCRVSPDASWHHTQPRLPCVQVALTVVHVVTFVHAVADVGLLFCVTQSYSLRSFLWVFFVGTGLSRVSS